MPKHTQLISADGDTRHLYPEQSKRIKSRKKVSAPAQDPTSEAPAPIPGFNLAGRPNKADEQIGGIYQKLIKSVKPIITGDLNTSSYWQFSVTTSNREWFRFNIDSLTAVLFGQYDNPNKSTLATDTAENKAAKHALRATKREPIMAMDPSVLATILISSVECTFNSVPNVTTSNLTNFMTQYARFSEVFHHMAQDYVATSSDWDKEGENISKKLIAASKYLDYSTFDATTGHRIPIRLHGIFPFESTCRPRAALNKYSNDNLFFPPNTHITIRINLKPQKNKLFFYEGNLSLDVNYFGTTAAAAPVQVDLTIQDVSLSYETIILEEKQHLTALAEFQKGMSAKYDFDIIYAMHQNIVSNQSYVSNDFQIPPYSSLICIMFLADHALFFSPSTNKPPSGFSRFPSNCTKMKLRFNGIPLIVDELENPGIASNNHNELSKRTLYNYMIQHRFYNGSFESYFPAKNDGLNQCIVVDMENLKSALTGSLTIETYYDQHKSTIEKNILVFSIHANGRAEAKLLNRIDHNYEWKIYVLPQ